MNNVCVLSFQEALLQGLLTLANTLFLIGKQYAKDNVDEARAFFSRFKKDENHLLIDSENLLDYKLEHEYLVLGIYDLSQIEELDNKNIIVLVSAEISSFVKTNLGTFASVQLLGFSDLIENVKKRKRLFEQHHKIESLDRTPEVEGFMIAQLLPVDILHNPVGEKRYCMYTSLSLSPVFQSRIPESIIRSYGLHPASRRCSEEENMLNIICGKDGVPFERLHKDYEINFGGEKIRFNSKNMIRTCVLRAACQIYKTNYGVNSGLISVQYLRDGRYEHDQIKVDENVPLDISVFIQGEIYRICSMLNIEDLFQYYTMLKKDMNIIDDLEHGPTLFDLPQFAVIKEILRL